MDETLAKRRAKKLNISYEEALAYFKDKTNRIQPDRQAYRSPFISAKSLSTGHKYPITIVCKRSEQGELKGKGFSTYGLSPDTTVPIF